MSAPHPGARRFGRGEAGSVTTEFVLILPLLISIFATTWESGMLMMRQVMLDHALGQTLHQLRADPDQPITPARIRDGICAGAAILPDCAETLRVALHAPIAGVPLPDPDDCAPDSGQTLPLARLTPARGRLVVVHVCAPVAPAFASAPVSLGLPRLDDGRHVLSAAALLAATP